MSINGKEFCPICKSEIIVKYVNPNKYYSIDHMGGINLIKGHDYNSKIEFICSKNEKHEIKIKELGIEKWADNITIQFKRAGWLDK